MISITAAVGALGTALVFSLSAAVWGDNPPDLLLQSAVYWPLGLWLVWGIVFYVYRKRVSERFDRAVSWLLNGSVLQFLVAVPCHIVVRQRDDCCAPVGTGIGIATGIAVMLMAFGPSVVFLYQRRLREYDKRSGALPLVHRWPIQKVMGSSALGAAMLFVFLPLDSSYRVSLSAPSEYVGDLHTGVAEIAEQFHLTVRPEDPRGFALLCGDSRVASVLTTVASDGRSETWDLRLRADQSELVAALRSLAVPPSEELWASNGPSSFTQWRAKLVTGAYFGRGCRPR